MSSRALVAVLMVALFAGCEDSEVSRLNNPNTPYLAATGFLNTGNNSAMPGTSGYDPISYWDGDDVSGPPSVVIYLNEQRAYFYKAPLELKARIQASLRKESGPRLEWVSHFRQPLAYAAASLGVGPLSRLGLDRGFSRQRS